MPTGSEVVPISITGTGAAKVLYGRHCRLHGFAVEETSQVALATFDLLDGGPTSSVIVIPVSISAQESTRDWYGETGIVCRGGLSIANLSGTFKGSVFVSDYAGDVAANVFVAPQDA